MTVPDVGRFMLHLPPAFAAYAAGSYLTTIAEMISFSSRALEDCSQAFQRRRLHQMNVEASSFRTAAIFFLPIAGPSDKDHTVKIDIGSNRARHLVAVHAGQANIEQHDLWTKFANLCQRGRSVMGGLDLMSA